MPPVYRIDLLKTPETGGEKFGEIVNYSSFSCRSQVNHASLLTASIPGDNPYLADAAFVDKCGVELWYKDTDLGIDWTQVFTGFFRAQSRSADPSTFNLTALGDLSRLSWRINAFFANTTNRTRFLGQKAETIMKTMVTYNATASATTGNGRIRNGAITGITVQADGAHGNTVDWYSFGDNLLDSLQNLAPIAGGDFDLIKTAAAAWNFRWYTGQRGTDRTADVVFSRENGSMNIAQNGYTYDRVDEKTVSITFGQGEDSARQVSVQTSSAYSATNDIEIKTEASSVGVDNPAGLVTAGNKALLDNRAVEELKFEVVQIKNTRFGVHYFLGDLCTAVNPFTGADFPVKIDAVTRAFSSDGKHTIKIETVTP